MTEYLKNSVLLKEINKSKLSYCEFYHDHEGAYCAIIDEKGLVHEGQHKKVHSQNCPIPFEEWLEMEDRSGLTVRRLTDEGIPKLVEPRPRAKRLALVPDLPFYPFVHELLHREADGRIGRTVVARSFHHNGVFNAERGRLSRGLCEAIMLLPERASMKATLRGYSYRDEMVVEAIAQLSLSVLKFDEHKSGNPFAYMTTVTNNAFKKVLNAEKRQALVRDGLRADHLPVAFMKNGGAGIMPQSLHF